MGKAQDCEFDLRRAVGYAADTDRIFKDKVKKLLLDVALSIGLHPVHFGVMPNESTFVSMPDDIVLKLWTVTDNT